MERESEFSDLRESEVFDFNLKRFFVVSAHLYRIGCILIIFLISITNYFMTFFSLQPPGCRGAPRTWGPGTPSPPGGRPSTRPTDSPRKRQPSPKSPRNPSATGTPRKSLREPHNCFFYLTLWVPAYSTFDQNFDFKIRMEHQKKFSIIAAPMSR